MNANSTSLVTFFSKVGNTWNQLWFHQADALRLCQLRIAIGLFTITWFYSLTPDLNLWFGPYGLAQDAAVESILDADFRTENANRFRWTILRLVKSEVGRTTIHVVGFTAAIALALGLATSFSAAVLVGILISYVHRAPILFGKTESLLISCLIYAAIGSAGQFLSLNHYFRGLLPNSINRSSGPNLRTNIALTLLQMHLGMIYLFSATSKLGGEVWWTGDAVWWMIVQPESTLVDLTPLGESELLLNLWTHAIVIMEFSMAFLIWFRPLRLILIIPSTLCWLSLSLISGSVGFCILMLILNFAFMNSREKSDGHESIVDDQEPSILSASA